MSTSKRPDEPRGESINIPSEGDLPTEHDVSGSDTSERSLAGEGGQSPLDSGDSTATRPQPGQRRYKLQERIAVSGQAEVWEAHDRRLNRQVAIKLLRKDLLKSKSSRVRFRTEAQTIAQLEHNHIVRLYDWGPSDKGPFLVMQLVRGPDLREYVKKHGKLAWKTAIRLLLPICDALEHAHQQGVVHRDIKPGNILVVPQRRELVALLTDFGLARREGHGDLTMTGTILGTESYMAPEQRANAKEAGPASDLWSLAATLYEVVTGETPNPVDLEQVPTPLRPVLRQALRRNPEDRQASVAEFAEQLQRLLDGEPTIVVPEQYRRLNSPFSPAQAVAAQQAWADHLGVDTTYVNSIQMRLQLIPPGEFQMGSPESEPGRFTDEHPHRVAITRPFWLGEVPVTQAEFQRVMGTNPSFFQSDRVGQKTDRFPAEMVSWLDTAEFCNRLSERENRTPSYTFRSDQVARARELYRQWLDDRTDANRNGLTAYIADHPEMATLVPADGYRLPTEAEWEYACRAGTTTAYNFGDSAEAIARHAWFGDNSGTARIDALKIWNDSNRDRQKYRDTLRSHGCRSHEVGNWSANAFGLRDMHGNVVEWLQDWYDENYYPSSPSENPTGPPVGSFRVLRGGSWSYDAVLVRSAYRGYGQPSLRSNDIGFRVLLSEF